jgi:hypothetical protein
MTTSLLGRRSLVRGAAWTMPAVALAAAAPAYAVVSGLPGITFHQGNSFVSPTEPPNGGLFWYQFQDASFTVTGPDIPPYALTLHITWHQDPGLDSRFNQLQTGDNAQVLPLFLGSVLHQNDINVYTDMYWNNGLALKAGSTYSFSNAAFFHTLTRVPLQAGNFVITFSAVNYQDMSYYSPHVPIV